MTPQSVERSSVGRSFGRVTVTPPADKCYPPKLGTWVSAPTTS